MLMAHMALTHRGVSPLAGHTFQRRIDNRQSSNALIGADCDVRRSPGHVLHGDSISSRPRTHGCAKHRMACSCMHLQCVADRRQDGRCTERVDWCSGGDSTGSTWCKRSFMLKHSIPLPSVSASPWHVAAHALHRSGSHSRAGRHNSVIADTCYRIAVC